ncbi:MAG: response regulator, partial [Gaiellaceae bacterium]
MAPIEGGVAALPTVLVVDDEDDIRALVMRALLHAGYRVFSALNADDALAVAALIGSSLDLLLTDGIMRPGQNGDVLAQTLRQSMPTLPVVLMSGCPPRSFNLAALPGVRFLPKPFGIEDLLNA